MATGSKIIKTDNESNEDQKTIPWIHSKHYFQKRPKVHLAIRTAFCGSLTTFASWNAQMIQMICTWDLSTIILAVYGYILGVQSCYMSLKFGQYISFSLYCWWEEKGVDIFENNNNDGGDTKEEVVIIQQEHELSEIEERKGEEQEEMDGDDPFTISKQEYINTFIPFLIVIPLFFYFLRQSISTKSVTSSIEKRNAYREIWVSCFFSPIGAIIRYKLSLAFNTRSARETNAYIPYLGTFLANISGSILAAICIAFIVLIPVQGWQQDVLYAIKLGFAGCLSTVSTFMDEFDTLLKVPVKIENKKAYYYVYGTLLIACLLGICIYAPAEYAVNVYI